MLDHHTRTRILNLVKGAQSDTDVEWWKQYGLAIVAGLGVFGPRRSLFEMQADPPAEDRSRTVRFLDWVDDPRRVVAVVVAAAIMLFVFPLAAAWARYQVLNSKAGNLDEASREMRTIREEALYYEQLTAKRWPMSKLLADISGAAPYDVQIEEITLDSESRVRLKATAPSNEQVTEFQQALSVMGMFGSPQVNRSAEQGRVEFEFDFEVRDPLLRVERPYSESLASVLYGEEAAAELTPGEYEGGQFSIPINRSSSSRRSENSNPGGRLNSSAADDEARKTMSESQPPRNALSSRASLGSNPNELPPILTQEQIDQMTYEEAHAASRVRARLMYSGEESTKTRLRSEFNRLSQRMKQVQPVQGGSSDE
jgi:Tfp pilus assembly protein PilN